MPTTKDKTTAADIMVEARVTIMPDGSLRDALDLMIEHRVSGLPVVSAMEQCIGIISASDILNAEQEHIADEDESLGAYFDADTQSWETIKVTPNDERLADISVLDVMSREILFPSTMAIHSKTSQRRWSTEDVHRVVVLDANESLKGIITAFDFVKQAAQ